MLIYSATLCLDAVTVESVRNATSFDAIESLVAATIFCL